jgi:hypothetical protein
MGGFLFAAKKIKPPIEKLIYFALTLGCKIPRYSNITDLKLSLRGRLQ